MFITKKLTFFFLIFSVYSLVAIDPRPLNILFVVEYFPARTQTFILNIIAGLIDRGHAVSIFSFRQSNVEGQQSVIEKYSLLDRVIYAELPAALPEYDIVFCQSASLGRKILEKKTFVRHLKKRKMVVALRGADITKNSVKENPAVYRALFRSGDLFLPVCDYFRNIAIALGCQPNKVIVHHSAINCSQFFFRTRQRPRKGVIHFVAVCRLVKKKGLDYAIRACAEIAKKYGRIHFSIVGEGPERASLELLVQQLNMQDKVTFHGWKMQEQIVSILDKSHIFLLPSVTAIDGDEEGIANALKEAMAMGLISVATWHAGTPELIDHGVSGYLVPEKNVPELVNILEHIIKHPKEWAQIGLAARKKIEDEFETKKSIEELEKLFYELLG